MSEGTKRSISLTPVVSQSQSLVGPGNGMPCCQRPNQNSACLHVPPGPSAIESIQAGGNGHEDMGVVYGIYVMFVIFECH